MGSVFGLAQPVQNVAHVQYYTTNVNGDIKILPFFASLWRSMLLYLCSGPAEKRQSISCRPTECNPLVTDTHFASHEFCIAISIQYVFLVQGKSITSQPSQYLDVLLFNIWGKKDSSKKTLLFIKFLEKCSTNPTKCRLIQDPFMSNEQKIHLSTEEKTNDCNLFLL